MQYAEAIKILQETASAHALSTEVCALENLVGRVSAETVRSPLTIPPFDNAAIDGFALRAELTGDAPTKLMVCGRLFPGETPPALTPQGQAWEIMTGAPVPRDCNACIKIEDVEVQRDARGQAVTVTIKQRLKPHDNIREAGGDFKIGDEGLRLGEVIRAEHLMALASFNKTQHKVFRKPRIVIAPTGKELIEPGQALQLGQIVNSTRPYLQAILQELGAEVAIAPTIPDDKDVFVAFLRKIMVDPPDLLLTTGAVSMGQADFVRPALEEISAQILFHRVDIRPGKPILFAEIKKGATKPFVMFGLPGNPVSSVVGSRFFIEPFLRACWRQNPEAGFEAKLSHDFKKPKGLRCFFKAQTAFVGGECNITLSQNQSSSMVQPLLHATAWAVLPEDEERLKAGDIVRFYLQDARSN